MESKFFSHSKIAKFQNIKVSTKLWKAQIILPWSTTFDNKVEKDKKSVWSISRVLN
jgi:hypothetical protein